MARFSDRMVPEVVQVFWAAILVQVVSPRARDVDREPLVAQQVGKTREFVARGVRLIQIERFEAHARQTSTQFGSRVRLGTETSDHG